MKTTHLSTDGHAVLDSTIETLGTNGETGDAKVSLCCGQTGTGDWLFFLKTNGDPVLLCEEGVGEWIETSGIEQDELIDCIKRSSADDDGKQWAIETLLGFGE